MKKIGEYVAKDGSKALVYFDREWGEYIVKFFNHQGVYMDASDYHTDNRDDAEGTARIATGQSRMKSIKDFEGAKYEVYRNGEKIGEGRLGSL